jgi:cyclopropane-fatty-acyl-phospholipid synthase
MKDKYSRITEEILSLAGIKINGENPWDIRVYNDKFYRRAITEGELGVGESYMEGWWDAERVDEFIYRVMKSQLDEKIKKSLRLELELLYARLVNLQTKRRAFIIGEKHYDLGNELFKYMLDSRMNYSCAYWENATTLDEAQENKLRLICNKLYLKPGMHILDIGCGWSAFGKYAAENYNVIVDGITVSKEQMSLGKELCDGLPVKIELKDYRDLSEKYDRIVSVGMFEHVGVRNYRTFFEIVSKCLKDDGIFLLHTIGTTKSDYTLGSWSTRYIFPNGMLPTIAHIGKAIEDLFVLEDWHSFGINYDKTLLAWYENFNMNWNKIKNKYSDTFYRMWKYFLLSSAGSFRSGMRNSVWQLVLTKKGIPGGYISFR